MLRFVKITGLITFFMFVLFVYSACKVLKNSDEQQVEVLQTNINGQGTELEIHFEKGKFHNHPTIAVWVEDMNENYVQTLYVTKSLATGTYRHGAKAPSEWKREVGEARRPATLPYYLHKRNIKAADNTYLPTPQKPIPDAYTGATPQNNFQLNTKTDKKINTQKFRILVEINQPWDWNEYWNATKYPDNLDYKTSCQPAVVYATTINIENKNTEYYLNPIGHSHYAGKDGNLYTDLRTITTALKIFEKISVRVK